MFQGTAFSKVEAKTYKKRDDTEVDDAYRRSSSRRKLRGTKYEGKLYDADGELISSSLYLDDGSYIYEATSQYTGLYKSDGDETVTVGVEEYTSPLYTVGTAYSAGLYTSFKEAEISTKDITALTV